MLSNPASIANSVPRFTPRPRRPSLPFPPPSEQRSRKRPRDENEPPQTPITSPPAYPPSFQYYYLSPPAMLLSSPHAQFGSGSPIVTALESSVPTQSKRPRRYCRRKDKLSALLDFVYDGLLWTIRDLMYHLFEFGDNIERSSRHTQSLASFLQGDSKHTPGEIIDLWMQLTFGSVEFVDMGELEGEMSCCIIDT